MQTNEELLQKYHNSTNEKERNSIIVAIYDNNEAYIKSLINKTVKWSESYTSEDFLSEGKIGLLKAIQYYDINSKIPFVLYAKNWILKYIMDALYNRDKLIPIPEYLYTPIKEHYLCNESIKDIAISNNINIECLEAAINIIDSSNVQFEDYMEKEEIENEEIIHTNKYQLSSYYYLLTPTERIVMRCLAGLEGEDNTNIEKISVKLKKSTFEIKKILKNAETKIKMSQKNT